MMRRGERETEEGGICEVNLVPLIDVSLVLVVMLLLASPMGFESSLVVRRAAASAKSAVETDPSERVEVRIVSEDEVVVNRARMPRAELEGALRPLLRDHFTAPVVVSCEDLVSHGTFVAVLDQTKQCGANEIAVMGR
jgi:biopolymer transport protein TolR